MNPIDIFAMARTGATLAGEQQMTRMPRLGASLMRQDGMLAYRCQALTDEQGRPAMNLWLRALLPLRCDRCGRELDFALSVERRFFFVASEAELAAIEIDDAPEEPLLGSSHFDLAGLIEDEAILQLPLSPRHAGCVAQATASAAAPHPNPFAQLRGLREQLRGKDGAAAGPAQDGDGSAPAEPKSRRTSR